MTTYLPRELQEGLWAARLATLKKTSRLRVQAGDEFYPVLRLWREGFAVEEATTPRLRGLVDLYEGGKHLYQCLIVAGDADAGEMRYEFKRNTAISDHAALDFYREPDAPAGLLSQD